MNRGGSWQKIREVRDVKVLLGDKEIKMEVVTWHLERVEVGELQEVRCAMHKFGVKDWDSREMWREIHGYLQNMTVPTWCNTERQEYLYQIYEAILPL